MPSKNVNSVVKIFRSLGLEIQRHEVLPDASIRDVSSSERRRLLNQTRDVRDVKLVLGWELQLQVKILNFVEIELIRRIRSEGIALDSPPSDVPFLLLEVVHVT